MAFLASLSASTMGFPISNVMISETSLILAWIPSPTRLISWALYCRVRFFWISNAALDRSSLQASSSLVMNLKVSLIYPVKGFFETMPLISILYSYAQLNKIYRCY